MTEKCRASKNISSTNKAAFRQFPANWPRGSIWSIKSKITNKFQISITQIRINKQMMVFNPKIASLPAVL